MRSAPRNWRKQRNLIACGHFGVASGSLAIDPDPADRYQHSEVITEFGGGVRQDRVDGRAFDRSLAGSGGDPNRGEETECWHQLKCTLSAMPRILLVRHGQSEWNAEGRWQGQADIALSDLGRAQARAASAKLGSFDVIASSTLLRAAETAYLISTELGIGPIVPVPELIERSAGEWSGLTKDDIERDWPGYLGADQRPPGYESDDELWVRIEAGMRIVGDLLQGTHDEGLVVAHGGLIYLLEARVGIKRGRIPNLGALWVDIAADGTLSAGERVELIDEAGLSSAQSSDIL